MKCENTFEILRSEITFKWTCTVIPVVSGHSKRRQTLGFQDGFSLNAGQKY